MKNLIKNLTLVFVVFLISLSNSFAIEQFDYLVNMDYSGYCFCLNFYNEIKLSDENINSKNIYVLDEELNKVDDINKIHFKFNDGNQVSVYLDDLNLEYDKFYYLVVDKNLLLVDEEKLGADVSRPFRLDSRYNQEIDIKNKDLKEAIIESLEEDRQIVNKGNLQFVHRLSLNNIENFSKYQEILILEDLNTLEFTDVDFTKWDDDDYLLLKEIDNQSYSLDFEFNDCIFNDFKGITDVLTVNSLKLNNCEVKDISDISKATELIRLDLIDMDLQDFDLQKELGNLTDVENLTIKYCNLNSIDFIKDYKYLSEIIFKDIDLKDDDLNAIFENKKDVYSLFMTDCNIEDIGFLSNLQELEELGIRGNNIKDFSVLKSIEFLEDIYISKSQAQQIKDMDINDDIHINIEKY